jgi:hypothetical protein
MIISKDFYSSEADFAIEQIFNGFLLFFMKYVDQLLDLPDCVCLAVH